jgi:hypothetical protein
VLEWFFVLTTAYCADAASSTAASLGSSARPFRMSSERPSTR